MVLYLFFLTPKQSKEIFVQPWTYISMEHELSNATSLIFLHNWNWHSKFTHKNSLYNKSINKDSEFQWLLHPSEQKTWKSNKRIQFLCWSQTSLLLWTLTTFADGSMKRTVHKFRAAIHGLWYTFSIRRILWIRFETRSVAPRKTEDISWGLRKGFAISYC